MHTNTPRPVRGVFLVVASLIICSAAHAQLVRNEGMITLTAEQLSWSLRFAAPAGAEVKKERYRPDGKAAYLFIADEETMMNVSVSIEPAEEGMTTAAYRDLVWTRTSTVFKGAVDTVKVDRPEYSTMEFILPEMKGIKVHQKSMNVHFVRDGYWVDVHISRMLFEPEHQQLFDAIVASITFLPRRAGEGAASAPADAMGYFNKGNAAFLRRDMKEAKQWYAKALEMEKAKPTLKADYRRVLIDNLGMAQAMSGDLAAAKETFTYGISQEPEYPMFHYNLACTHAELEEMDPCITSLKRAFALKKNMIEGEQMPDPAADDSFHRFMKEEKFRKALEEIANAGK